MCGTYLGGVLYAVAFAVGVNHVGGDWSFDCGGGSFVPQCDVDCVNTNEKLLCARYFVVENVLARAFV